MKKIPSLFKRNYDGDRLVYDEVVEGSEWVLAGEGYPTEKFDGTACLFKDGQLYARYDAKHGKTPPDKFLPAQPEPDPVSGHWPGWRPIDDRPQDKYHQEALANASKLLEGQTYELVGPKVQKNPYDLLEHQLWRHGAETNDFDGTEVPRTFAEIKEWLAARPHVEGIVWHHNDGRMVKIKAKDFGLPRGLDKKTANV